MSNNLSNNLKAACATRHSISEICRDLDMNRQQFNRYINGYSQPSPHNLRKIAHYFQIPAEDFNLPAELFQSKMNGIITYSVNHTEFVMDFFKADLPNAEQYLGYYQTFHVSPSWPDYIICSLTRIKQEKEWIQVKSIERIYDPINEVKQISKYSGLFSISRNKIFIVEKSHRNPSLISETILQPFDMHQKRYLKGLTIGVSWRQDNMPYAAKTIWKKLNKNINIKNIIKKCGHYKGDSHELPEPVKNYFSVKHLTEIILS